MADTETTVPFVDGAADIRDQLSLLNANGDVAPQTGIRSNDAFVSNANPFPVQLPPNAGAYSSAAEASHVIKASAGTLYAVSFSATSAGWLMIFDSATVPVDGATIPRRSFHYDPTVHFTLERTFSPPLKMSNGIAWAFSSTGPFTKTITGSIGAFSGEFV